MSSGLYRASFKPTLAAAKACCDFLEASIAEFIYCTCKQAHLPSLHTVQYQLNQLPLRRSVIADWFVRVMSAWCEMTKIFQKDYSSALGI